MKLSTRKLGIISASAAAAILLAAILVHPAGVAFSQQPPDMEHGMPGNMPDMMQHHQEMMQHHQQMMQQMHGQGAGQMDMAMPTMPGQDAFGAIQEIVRILEADPNTDWSKVNLEALRQHLIDMNEVTLKANAVAKPVDGGIEVTVTGTGRTVEAIQRMIPAHAQMIEQSHLNGWSAKTEPLPEGVVLTVTTSDPQQAQHIRGLGFIGVMVSGSHHQAHHLAMAKGEFVHSQ
jgi:hypothetical protein